LNPKLVYGSALVLMGMGWGLTQPLSKIAVSTGRLPLGLIFWQFLIGAVFLGMIRAAQGKGLPIYPKAILVYVIIAFTGTLLPNTASYLAYPHVPAGIMSIIISLVPMLAFPLAVLLGSDHFSLARLLGLVLGLVGVLLIIAPSNSLPAGTAIGWVLVALVAPFFYALEANIVGKWGTAGLSGIDVLYGASAFGTVISLPIALVSGQMFVPDLPLTEPDYALAISAAVHALSYSCYVWLVGRAGPTYAAQSSYMVTLFGILWAIALLGERYSLWIWLSLGLVLAGLILVRPQDKRKLEYAP
jgi:drug/metabolite transporter (DMT)-like permease